MLKLMMLMVFSGCTSQTSTADELRRLRGRLRKNFSLLSELVIKRPCSSEIILLALKFTTRATWFSFRSVWQQVIFTNTSQMLLQTAPRQSSRNLPDTLHILPWYHLRHPQSRHRTKGSINWCAWTKTFEIVNDFREKLAVIESVKKAGHDYFAFFVCRDPVAKLVSTYKLVSQPVS